MAPAGRPQVACAVVVPVVGVGAQVMGDHGAVGRPGASACLRLSGRPRVRRLGAARSGRVHVVAEAGALAPAPRP